jgi:GrpB-like predicted nucleotidyltransferase (UPF0157 family)
MPLSHSKSQPDSAAAAASRRVLLVPHNIHWADEFGRESAVVAGAMGDLLAAIHHIGSTAIPGIRAKPVIDILAVVRDVGRLDERNPQWQALGYEAMGEFGIPGRRYFRKDDAAGSRTHQVHAFQAGSPQIERHLAFRDFLRAHRECALQYESLKLRLAELFPADIASYTDGKDEFIKEMDAKAAAWRQAIAANA